MRRFVVILMVFGVAFCGSCSEDDAVTPTHEKLPVNFDLTLEDSVVVVGNWVAATIRFIADSDEPVVLDFENPCLLGYNVYSGYKEVVEYPIDCEGDSRTLVVRTVGEHTMYLSVPTIEYDMDNVVKNGAWRLDVDQLPPGVYRLRAGFIGYAKRIPWVEVKFTVID